MSTKLPILVVGSGPAGLACAITLAKNDVPVRIIEQRTSFHGGIRGTTLVCRSQELLAFLGILDDVKAISTPAFEISTYGPDGRDRKNNQWVATAGDTVTCPYPEVITVSQADFEGVLRKHLSGLGVDVETGCDFVGLTQDVTKVVARVKKAISEGEAIEETIDCSFLVAGDGAKGRTRKMLGITFAGETKDSERILSGSLVVSGVDKEHWHIWGNIGTAGMSLKPMYSGNMFQMQCLGLNLPEHLPTDLDGIRKLFVDITHREDIIIHSADWVSEWRANIRMCEKFGDNRVFLVGDAAHCHSPFGGQGMNTGIQDSLNLAWKLSSVWHGHATRDLLESYGIERIPVVAEMLNLSTSIHTSVFRPSGSTLELGQGTEVDNVQVMQRPRSLLQLGVNYRWSPIVHEERAGANADIKRDPYGQQTDRVRAGDRAPDAPVLQIAAVAGESDQDTRLHRLIDTRRHIVLVFLHPNEDASLLPQEVEALAGATASETALLVAVLPQGTVPAPDLTQSLSAARILVDSQGHARKAYNLDLPDSAGTEDPVTAAFVVIRPDGYIGAFTNSARGVKAYFDNLWNGGQNRS